MQAGRGTPLAFIKGEESRQPSSDTVLSCDGVSSESQPHTNGYHTDPLLGEPPLINIKEGMREIKSVCVCVPVHACVCQREREKQRVKDEGERAQH